ncbi:hypothetical protein BJV74DRAFT_795937 [Russula compacta]|nr:hypothetical protein BJV74DRAFT_795937 [Russula compacta]
MCGCKLSEALCNIIICMLPVLDISDIEAYTGVSKSQIQRVQALYNQTGHGYKVRDTRRMGRHHKLTLENIQYVQGVLARKCDTYLDEVQAGLENNCGETVSMMSVWQAIHRSGYSLKNVTCVAMEMSTEKHAAFTFQIGIMYSPEQLVFIDECSVDRHVGRGYGYALWGHRAVRKSLFVQGRR